MPRPAQRVVPAFPEHGKFACELAMDLGIKRIDSHDVADHELAVSPFEVEFTQLAAGAFCGSIETLDAGGVVLYRESWNRPIRALGQSPASHYFFAIPVHKQVRVEWNGVELDSERLAFAAPGSEVNFQTGADALHIALLLSSDRIEEYYGTGTHHGLTGQDAVTCDPQLRQKLSYLLQAQISEVFDRRDCVRSDVENSELDFDLLFILEAVFGSNAVSSESPDQRKKVYADACEYLREQGSAVSMPQLATAVGVSQRTLQYAFLESVGMTPNRFFRLQRIGRAHSELRRFEPHATTVQEIAAKWGFGHLGRFASEHRRMFGVSPSKVLSSRKIVHSIVDPHTR